MQRNLPGFLSSVIIVFSFFTWSCNKIDTTTLGGNLIPAVDNVHTFADTLSINCTQGIFNDSTRLGPTEFHVLGSITNDPVFGKTSSDLFLELKPSFYPYYFGNKGDTVESFDSVVLCLSYRSYYGDTNVPQHISVYQLRDDADFVDSLYKLNFRPDFLGQPLLGDVTVKPYEFRNYTYFRIGASLRDSVNNQVRIRLDDNAAFLDLLTSPISRDTSRSDCIYKSDSNFKEKMKGFAVVADRGQGNGLVYISLTDLTTRLEFHYKKRKNNILDTTSSAFYFSTGLTTPASAHATNLERDRTGAEFNPPQTTTDVVYIQATPGSYANLSIPGLSAFENRVIHRAEIFVEQIAPSGPVDEALAPPLYLYLDLVDTASGSPSKPIYYDLNPSSVYFPDNSTALFYPSSGIDFRYFGGYRRVKDDGTGPLYYYNFNISRYVQHLVTDHINNYKLKLYAPYNLSYYGTSIPFNNNLGYGRIKVGSGNNSNVNYRMKMRIVSSKI